MEDNKRWDTIINDYQPQLWYLNNAPELQQQNIL